MNQVFKNGQTVLFQGDSITDCGRNREDSSSLGEGYASKAALIYQTLFPHIHVNFVNKGVSGNRSSDLLLRYESDIREVKPDFISIMIGINDVWRRYDQNDETSTLKYEQNYKQLLTQIKTDLPNTRIMLIEPFLLYTVSERRCWREDLSPKIEVVRDLAREFADYYLPLDGILIGYQARGMKEETISLDGVHPLGGGHGIIAAEYLKCIGVI